MVFLRFFDGQVAQQGGLAGHFHQPCVVRQADAHLVDSLALVAAVIHTGLTAVALQGTVAHGGPLRPPVFDQFTPTLGGVELAGFLAEGIALESVCGELEVRVPIALIPDVLPVGLVDVSIHGHRVLIRDCLGDLMDQCDPFIGVELGGNRQLDFSRQQRILSAIVRFDGVPEMGAISPSIGHASREGNTALRDVGLARTIVPRLASPFVSDQLTGAVGSSSNGAP
jgi:hypothetical protein